jgi:hypothetical protein
MQKYQSNRKQNEQLSHATQSLGCDIDPLRKAIQSVTPFSCRSDTDGRKACRSLARLPLHLLREASGVSELATRLFYFHVWSRAFGFLYRRKINARKILGRPDAGSFVKFFQPRSIKKFTRSCVCVRLAASLACSRTHHNLENTENC